MLKILVLTLLALAVAAGAAGAQTATQYDELSPGNQKIATALFDAQETSGQPTYSLDDIAVMKQSGKGWGVIFKEMQAQGKIPPDVKNLGQLVSGKYKPQPGPSGSTTITTASGKSQVVGKPDAPGKPGKGYFDEEGSSGARGSTYRDNSGRGSFSSGPGRGDGYGRGGSGSGPSGGGRGAGRGK